MTCLCINSSIGYVLGYGRKIVWRISICSVAPAAEEIMICFIRKISRRFAVVFGLGRNYYVFVRFFKLAVYNPVNGVIGCLEESFVCNRRNLAVRKRAVIKLSSISQYLTVGNCNRITRICGDLNRAAVISTTKDKITLRNIKRNCFNVAAVNAHISGNNRTKIYDTSVNVRTHKRACIV